MNFQIDNETPIFVQLSDWLSDMIMSGIIGEEEQIPSTTEISSNYKINPATALKGINILVDKEIIYKKRGVGMFVCKGAAEKIKKERIESFYLKYIETMLREAKKLGLTDEDIISLIKEKREGEQ